MAKKSTVIIGVVVAIVVVVAVGAFIALQIVNTRAETEIARNIDQTIQSSGMGDSISYGSVDVQAARGTVTITDLAIDSPDDTTSIRANRISVRVPPGEAAALASNPSTATISEVAIQLEGMSLDSPTAQVGFTAASSSIEVKGTLSQKLQGDPVAILNDVDSIAFSADEMEIKPGEMMLAQMQMQGATWMADEENRRIDHVAFDAALSPDQMELTGVDFESPMLSATGEGVIAISPMLQPMPQSMKYEVSEIHPELRQQVTMMASMFGMSVPAEGGFTFEYTLGADGMPAFTIE